MIQFIEKEKVFKIDTPNSSYVIGVFEPPVHMDKGVTYTVPNEGDTHFNRGYLMNLYYGKSLPDNDIGYLWKTFMRRPSASFSPADPTVDERLRFSVDVAPMEYGTFGRGDMRISAAAIGNEDGNDVTDLRYQSFKIYSGREDISPLPSIRCGNNDSETLELTLVDTYTLVEVKLYYTVVNGIDAIIRSAKFINKGEQKLKLERAFSTCIDLPRMDYDFITLYGRHGWERSLDRRPLAHGVQSIKSVRGVSSHNNNPFGIFCDRDANETHGEVYGFNFVYSGNFELSAECNHNSTTRIIMGISPESFEWNLTPGDSFQTPEAVTVYSDEGIGKMSRQFHDLYNYHLINPDWQPDKVVRPVLINSWEAAYFDFDTDKILSFARRAKSLGFEMLVMDDGWFGARNDDTNALGDWFANEEKLPGGVKRLSDELHKIGMKFGIWFEPEMISPDSELFRAHPDWFVHVPGRGGSLGRHQYIADVSRQDVRDGILEQMFAIFDSCKIEYIKWDFNRNISEPGSSLLDEEHSREFYHRFILGTYDMMDRFTKRYPDVLFENCSGGGGRFDPGMLYFSPQIWASDNTDPINRLQIQQGTSLCYPASCMGAHVSDCPRTSYKVKGDIALWGTFGYELDPNKLTLEECEIAKTQIEEYHKYYDLIHCGDLYRLVNEWDKKDYSAWMFVSKDGSEALATIVTTRNQPEGLYRLKLQGLDRKARYVDDDGNEYTGAELMSVGIDIFEEATRTYVSNKFHFTKVK